MKLFEILLVVLTLSSGLILLADKLYFAKRRAARAGLLDSEPVLVDYSRAFFPVLAIVLVVRSFIAEPYKIPSSSMMPNLLIGDFILVNKFAYGLRLPLNNAKVVPVGEPARGDVVVFHTVLETDYPRGEGQWTVPPGKYLVMGDNRDNSDDGRFWGLLPEENLRGKAFLIWLNCSGWFCKDGFEPSRIGTGIN